MKIMANEKVERKQQQKEIDIQAHVNGNHMNCEMHTKVV